jgi:hypothetical protein
MSIYQMGVVINKQGAKINHLDKTQTTQEEKIHFQEVKIKIQDEKIHSHEEKIKI